MKRHSTLRKMLVSALVLAVSVVAAMALEVSRGELQSVNSDTIRFNNYNGPHTGTSERGLDGRLRAIWTMKALLVLKTAIM